MNDAGLTLSPQCTLRDADELKSSLAALVEAPDDITVDASSVERIDTASLQLLVAFVATRKASGRVVRWTAPSETFMTCAMRLGLRGPLQLDAGG